MLEKDIEREFVQEVKAAGGRAYKFTSPGNAGVPDRLVLFPGGCIAFAELKAPGRSMTALQKAQAERIERLGFPVRVIAAREDIVGFIKAFGLGGSAAK